MSDCKHVVGVDDNGYEGLSQVFLGDEVFEFASDITFYKFCPLCGEELSGKLVTIYVPPSRDDDESVLSPNCITREALKMLNGSLPFYSDPRDIITKQCLDKVTIRKPVEYPR